MDRFERMMKPADPNHTVRSGRNGVAARVASAVLALALASAWLVPSTQVNENRLLNQFAAPTADGISSGRYFRATDTALVDHLGAKSAAVSLVSSALLDLGFSPSVDVVRGVKGEPFYAADFRQACTQDIADTQFSTDLEAAKSAFAARGIYFLYAIVPDKSSVEHDLLGPLGPSLMTCADRSRTYLEALAGQSPSLLTAWPELRAAHDGGKRVYLYGDTHWNYRGAAIFAELLLDKLAQDGQAPPGLFAPDDVVEDAEADHVDDLFTLMGQVRTERVTPLESRRPGVTTTEQSEKLADGSVVRRWISQSDTAPLIGGRTLVVRDSMFEFDYGILAPYFSDLTAVPIASVTDPGDLARLGHYDRIIIQQVQRDVPGSFLNIAGADWY